MCVTPDCKSITVAADPRGANRLYRSTRGSLYRDVSAPLALVCGHNHKVTAMSLELIFAFVLFAFVTSVTPGPNNMMLLASGVNFSVRRSLPHMLGISLGFMVLVMAVGLGLSQVFQQVPVLYTLLRYIGAAYLLYLAWKIAGSGAPDADSAEKRAKPFTFLQAAAFQWVNPKAWVMAIGAITT